MYLNFFKGSTYLKFFFLKEGNYKISLTEKPSPQNGKTPSPGLGIRVHQKSQPSPTPPQKTFFLKNIGWRTPDPAISWDFFGDRDTQNVSVAAHRTLEKRSRKKTWDFPQKNVGFFPATGCARRDSFWPCPPLKKRYKDFICNKYKN
jgi:hypothetical protein